MKLVASITFFVSGCTDTISSRPAPVPANKRFFLYTATSPGSSAGASAASNGMVRQIFRTRPRKVVQATGAGLSPRTMLWITINENADPSVKGDMLRGLAEIAPADRGFYRHAEGNSDAHIKASLVGFSEHIIVKDGRLVLGTWQGIYFAEFDGPRSRRLFIKLQPD